MEISCVVYDVGIFSLAHFLQLFEREMKEKNMDKLTFFIDN